LIPTNDIGLCELCHVSDDGGCNCVHVTSFAEKSSEDDVGFTDDNQKWLIPAKKTKLTLSDSDEEDDDVSNMPFISL